MEAESAHPLARFLAINRTVGIVLISVLLFGLGEQLWSEFMPAYLEVLTREEKKEVGTTLSVAWKTLLLVGLYGFLRNLFEGFCYISGGYLTARLGDRGSLMLFGTMTISGYLLFLTMGEAEWAAVLAALLILGWEPLSVPVTFTTVGSTVTDKRRGMAFAVQSIQKRLPKIIGPLLAGFAIDWCEQVTGDRDFGRVLAMQWLVAGALGLGILSLLVQWRWMPVRKVEVTGASAWEIVLAMPAQLRRLLIAEIFTRWCDWLVRDFVILYVLIVHQVEPKWAGMLMALQHTTALLTYLPIGRMTQSTGLQPFIGLTFVFFALFPLSLALVPSAPWLVVAYVVYGLREIGEPARKALITSLMPEAVRARGVGLYWGIRSFAVCTASLVGAYVWAASGPQDLLYLAFALGCVGAAVFYLFVYQPPPP